MFLISTASFYFWESHYDPVTCLDLIGKLDLQHVDGCDIYIDPNRCRHFVTNISTENKALLAGFVFNTLHTDLLSFEWKTPFDDNELKAVLVELESVRAAIDTDSVVIHGDFFYQDAKKRLALIREYLPNAEMHLEMMGSDKQFATNPAHMLNLLSVDSEIFITPDIAHMQDWKTQFSWKDIFEDPVLKERIKIVHASHHTQHLKNNWYIDNGYEECDEAVHSLLQCDPEAFNEQDDHAYFNGKVVVLEGILPVSININELIKTEIRLITRHPEFTT